MDSSVYLAIGILCGLLYGLTATLILINFTKPNVLNQPSLPIEALRKKASGIQGELQELEQQIWLYGIEKEEENKKWRRVYRDFASKTINTLNTCWVGKDDDPTAKATYDELITGLKSIGVEEIRPEIGEKLEEAGQAVSLRVIKGKSPFVVKRLVYPGYQLNSRHLGSIMILAPAVVEVIGQEEE